MAHNRSPQSSCLTATTDGRVRLTIAGHAIEAPLHGTRFTAIDILTLGRTGLRAVAYADPAAAVSIAQRCAAGGLRRAPVVVQVTSAVG